jgi:hypothetical protein
MAKHIATGSILAGQALSTSVNITSADPALIIMPLGWNGADAFLTFQISYDGITFYDLFDSAGREVKLPLMPNTVVRLDATLTRGINYVKMRAGSRVSPIIQTAQRDFSVVTDDQ